MNSYCGKLRSTSVLVTAGLLGICLSLEPLRAQASGSEPEVVPTRAEQETMLKAVAQYAGQYISRLPNFICTQVTQQFEAGRKTTHWRNGDTLRFKLVFDGGREERSIELVNNEQPRAGRRWRTPLSTEGEFGTLLGSVFGASSNTSFTWHGWERIRSQQLAVFDFAVDREHSTLKLTLSDLAQAVLPYHGSVYANPETGGVWRIISIASEIPREIRTKSTATTIDYDEVAIGGIKYLLPVEASVLVDTGSSHIRNEMTFNEYRKFEADSSIIYSYDADGGEPGQTNPHK